MADDKKRGGLLAWLLGDKRAEDNGRISVVKIDTSKLAATPAAETPTTSPASPAGASPAPVPTTSSSTSSSTPSSTSSGAATSSHAARASEGGLKRDVTERYLDKGEIARGGMGSVRKVFDENLQRTVAMKVCFPEHQYDPKIMARFAEEAQIMGQLEHPNIVPVHDFSDDDGTRYLTMLYVRGKTLTQLLGEASADVRPDYFRFLTIFLRVCDAVAFAHSRGVVHRDLKPDNIMVGNFGEVYLMDWGIAKLLHRVGGGAPVDPHQPAKTIAMTAFGTSRDDIVPVRVRIDGAKPDEDGQIIGTFFYMSPEQAHAEIEHIDERTDIFLLGGILYEILTQRPPYVGATVVEVVRHAQACVIPRPEEAAPEAGIPKALSDICMKCLRRDRAQRYATVLDLKKDIETFLKGGSGLPTRSFASGEHLMREGDPGDEVFIVQKGTVQVYQTDQSTGRRRGLATLKAGAVVGEAAVFRSAPRTASVVAVDDVVALVVTRRQLESELGLNTWVGSLVRALSDRFFAANDRFTKADEENHRLRVSTWLLQYIAIYGRTGPSQRREVQWSHVLAATVAKFQKTEDEVRTILEALATFTIDEERDAVWCSAGGDVGASP
jgi:eukaryotic-like serine/threonine-protein kinase